MRIGAKDTDDRVLVVAEIGNNHEGSLATARELVKRAADAGADAVKFQTYRTESFVSPSDSERYARLEAFRLEYEAFAELAGSAHDLGLAFLSTPLDLASADFLKDVVDAFKIASGDNDFFPLIERIAHTRKPMIIATGLADLDGVKRIEKFVRDIRGEGDPGLCLLHCVAAYPAPPGEANLRAISTLAQHFDCVVGYSDHTLGIEACVLAVALGARIIEKHFTLDKTSSGFRDHQLSADPTDLGFLVKRVRDAELMLGSGVKTAQPSEHDGLVAYRRSIAAARPLRRGTRVEFDDLVWLRPGGGLAPGSERLIVGKALRRSLAAGDQISEADVK